MFSQFSTEKWLSPVRNGLVLGIMLASPALIWTSHGKHLTGAPRFAITLLPWAIQLSYSFISTLLVLELATCAFNARKWSSKCSKSSCFQVVCIRYWCCPTMQKRSLDAKWPAEMAKWVAKWALIVRCVMFSLQCTYLEKCSPKRIC